MSAQDLTLSGASYGTHTGFGQSLSAGWGQTAAQITFTSSTVTCALWLKAANSGTLHIAASQQGCFFIGSLGGLGIGHYRYNTAGGEVQITGTANLRDGNWHHVEMNIGPSGAKVFVDGVLDGSNSTAASFSPTDVFCVGRYIPGNSSYDWGGEIDEVALFSTIQHTANFTAPTSQYSGTATNLTHLYHLDGDGIDSVGIAVGGDTTAPVLTGSVTATPSGSNVSLSWTAGTDNVGITSYEYSLDSGTWTAFGTTATTQSLTGLANGSHTVQIRAKDAAGNTSNIITTGSFTIASSDVTAPTLTGTVTAIPTGPSVALSWPAGSDNVGIATYEYILDSGSVVNFGGSSTSQTIIVNTLGSHTIQIRAKDAAGNASAYISGSFTITSITDTTPPTLTGTVTCTPSGSSVSVSWTAGSDNVGITSYEYALNSGSWTAFGSLATTQTIPGLAAGSYNIAVRGKDAAGNISTSIAGSFSISGTSGVIAPNNPAIVYSPYNWDISSSSAIAINMGAYFRTFFTGPSCVLNFDIAGQDTNYPVICIIVDGQPAQYVTIAATVTVTIPAYLGNSTHLLEVYVDKIYSYAIAWSALNTGVKFTGLTLASGQNVRKPQQRDPWLVYGDSITEGAGTLGLLAGLSMATNSAMACYPLKLGELLNVEMGVVACGSTGIQVSGQRGTPALTSSWNYLRAGVPRDFSTPPKGCIWLEGTNDGSNNTTAAATTILNDMLAAMAGTRFYVFRPLNGNNQAGNLAAAAAGCTDPSRVKYIDTAGFWSSTDSADGTHPYGYIHLGSIAPEFAAAIQSAFPSSGTTTVTNTVYVPITDTVAPVLTGTVTGTPSGSSVVLSWPAGSDAQGVTAYEYSLNAGTTWVSSPFTISQSLGSLADGAYNIQVRAKDAAGNISNAISGSFTINSSSGSGSGGGGGSGTGPTLAISVDYAGLQTMVAKWLHRTDLSAEIPVFIASAENYLNYNLRTNDQVVKANLTRVSEGVYSLPYDFIEAQRVVVSTAPTQRLTYTPPPDFDERYPVLIEGTAQTYTIEGNTMRIGNAPSATAVVELLYRQRLPSLSNSNTTNWLTVKNYNAYLFGTLTFACQYLRDDEGAARFDAMLTQATNDLNVQDWASSAELVIRNS